MNEELNEYYEQKMDDARSSSWLIALVTVFCAFLAVALGYTAYESIQRDPESAIRFIAVGGFVLAVVVLRFTIYAVMRHRIRTMIAKRAMTV